MRFDPIRRRMFLQGIAGSALAIPFLSSLLPRGVAQAAGAQAKRFIAIKSYSTQNIVDWYPTQSGNGYSTRPLAGGHKEDGTTILTNQLAQSSGSHQSGGPYYGHSAPLSDFAAQGVSNVIDSRFNPYLGKMALLRGLDFLPHTNHNDGGMLGNFAGALEADGSIVDVPTIDQVLAYSDKFYPSAPAGTRALHLSPGQSNTFSYTSGGIVGGQVSQMQAHTDPLTAFNEVFANVTIDPMEEPTVNPNIALIDRVYEDYLRISTHNRLSSVDRQTLELHMSYLSEIQARLEAGGSVNCTLPAEPPSLQTNNVDVATLESAFDLMIDIAVAAMMCDLTRIVTINVFRGIGRGIGPSGEDVGFVHSGLKDPTDWHETAHDWGLPQQDAKVLAINQWIANEIFFKLIERLDVDEDGSSTMLDNSVVMWGNELGFNHLNWSIPTMLAGSAGGCLDMGRYIDYIDWNQQAKFGQNNGAVIEGIPYNRLLVSLLQAFGLSPADYEPYNDGDPGYGSSSTAGKTFNLHAIDYDFGQVDQPLPTLNV